MKSLSKKSKQNKLSLESYLKEYRLKRNISQKELSKFADISVQLISNYERGRCKVPTKHLVKLAKVIDVDIDEVIDIIIAERRLELKKFLKTTC